MKNKVIFREYEVIIESKNDKVIDYTGDKSLIGIIKTLFEIPIQVTTGGQSEDKKGNIIHWDGIKELKPGDKDYIDSVLMEKVRNELGMEIE